jgi:hypothetical protein
MDLAIPGTPRVCGLHCLFGGYGEEENRAFSAEPVEQGSEQFQGNLFIFRDSWSNHLACWMID